jgi:4-diphosphocytidyl-2-C-methyl-D-erythritol kinase
MHLRRLATHVEVLTPAKINLFLEVLAKRPDGFHEIETLMAAVTIYDSVVFAANDGHDDIHLSCSWSLGSVARENAQKGPFPTARELLFGEIPQGRDNLAWRAAALVRERAGIRRGATIRLTKRIPAAAGLGGASSDAAATLVAANAAWQLGWSRQRLAELAAELGSDVPFFLTPGAAVCRGRGEQIESVAAPRLHLIVVRPPFGLATPQVYKQCRPSENPTTAASLLAALSQGDAARAARHLKNALQPAASRLTPWITKLQTMFDRQDVLGHQMSGSGSSYFGIARSARHARRLASRLKAQGVGAVFSASTTVAT